MPDKNGIRKSKENCATHDRIDRLLGEIESRFECESGRALVADYIRVLQLELELAEDSRAGQQISNRAGRLL
jgi:hypothetical protein